MPRSRVTGVRRPREKAVTGSEKKLPVGGAVRGLGMMLGIEPVADKRSIEPV